MFTYPFRLPFKHPFRAAFSLPGFGEVAPPISDDLLVQLKGNNTDDGLQKIDSWAKPYRENFTMTKSACVALNGTDEVGNVGVISSEHIEMSAEFVVGTIGSPRAIIGREYTQDSIAVSDTGELVVRVNGSNYENQAPTVIVGDKVNISVVYDQVSTVVVVNGVEIINSPQTGAIINNNKPWQVGTHGNNGWYFDSTVCNVTINGIHFRIAETSGLTSFSDDYLTDGHYITWIAVEANLWAQTQDDYHGNAVDGYGKAQEAVKFSKDYTDGVVWVAPGTAIITQENGYQNITQGSADKTFLRQYDIKNNPSGEISIRTVVRKNDIGTNGAYTYIEVWTYDSAFGNILTAYERVPTNVFTPFTFRRTTGFTDLRYFLKHNDSSPGEIDVKSISIVESVGISVYINGDSIHESAYDPSIKSAYNCYGSLFSDKNKLEFYNNAVGGSLLSEIHTRVTADIVTHGTFPISFLGGGTNDISLAGSDPVPAMSVEQSATLDELVPVSDVTVLSTIPVRAEWTSEQQVWADNYNTWVRAEVLSRGITLLDIHETVSPNGIQNPLYFTSDTTHPNVAGHYAITDAVNIILPSTVKIWNHSDIPTGNFALSGNEYLPFLNEHKGGTFNGCETSSSPESFSVGEPNGVGDTFIMDADHGTIVSHGSLDTAIPTYVHPTITFTAGIIRDILFSDGMLMQIREGEGSVLHDSEGNIVGTANVTLPTFWEGAPMVAQSIIDAEAAQGSAILTDGNGHSVPRTQTWLEDNLNANNQHYFCEQLLIFKRVLTESEDIAVKDYLPCWTVSYLIDGNGDKLVDGNGDYLTVVDEV